MSSTNLKYSHPSPGERFGRLVFMSVSGRRNGEWLCQCKCDCGNTSVLHLRSLRRGYTTSCGCLRRELNRLPKPKVSRYGSQNHHFKHGGKRDHPRLYRIWQGMQQRCYNSAEQNFRYYGGKGITVCDSWRHDFVVFRDWSLANGYDDRLTIDRKDSALGYSPDNCRWASMKTQCRNRTRQRLLTAFGETKCFAEWMEDPRCRVRGYSLYDRLNKGWSDQDAIATPPQQPRLSVA
jgi:hypothetical protein